jgi:large subunit ribosomal protein L17e
VTHTFFIAAKARADDVRVHFKNTYETANAVKGLKLRKAIRYMEDVLEHKQIIPYKKHTGGVGRKA